MQIVANWEASFVIVTFKSNWINKINHSFLNFHFFFLSSHSWYETIKFSKYLRQFINNLSPSYKQTDMIILFISSVLYNWKKGWISQLIKYFIYPMEVCFLDIYKVQLFTFRKLMFDIIVINNIFGSTIYAYCLFPQFGK